MDRQILRSHLRKQLEFLERSCCAYDRGYKDESIRISVVLRVLFHDTGRSPSLLQQLGSSGIKLLSTVDPVSFDPDAIRRGKVQYQGMVQMRLGTGGVVLRPGLGDRGYNVMVPVTQWWNQLVMVIPPGSSIRRRDIVLGAADKDGGAHVDPKMDPDYARLTQDIGIHFYVSRSDGSVEHGALAEAHLVSLRQMGYEVLHSPELCALCDA